MRENVSVGFASFLYAAYVHPVENTNSGSAFNLSLFVCVLYIERCYVQEDLT